ncbi:MAG: recombination mediator RecR [Bacteroidales bacterium OttesenSCG-928-I14]|jgi:recombination protein RecR|nr:recombination mediator RecR [Bacteroidales bacterium OttesenSCG-928-I14]
MEKYPSFLLENAINEFAKLPGIGRKTALRLVFHSLKRTTKEVENFGRAIIALRNEINYCKVCYNICDNEICDICSNTSRDISLICVVENIKEVMAIENTKQFHGLYHVLGGVISPMEGVGPGDLQIKSLIERVKNGKVREIILALSTTMEGDTTNFYIYRKISNINSVKISTLARGVSIGDEIEYTDEITLGKSILNRIDFSKTIVLQH